MESTTETLQETDGLVVYEKKAIERVNPLREKLNELKELHKEFPDLSTTAGQKVAKEQIKSFRDLKGITEAERKDVKGIINKLAKTVDESYNAVWDDAAKEQEWRDVKLKEFEKEKERLAQEKKEAEEKIKITRFVTLNKMGAMETTQNEQRFVMLGSFSIESRLVGSSSEEVWQNHILRGFKEQYDIIEAERQAEELRKKEEAEKLRQEQEELQRQQEEFNRKQAEFKREQEEFEAKQREAERLEKKRQQEEEQKKRWEEAEKQRQLEKARQGKIFERLDQLHGDLEATPVGWAYNGHIVLTDEDLAGFTDDDFNRVRDFHNKRVADNRAEEERIKNAAEEENRREAALAERKKSRLIVLAGLDYFNDDIEEFIGGYSDEDWNKLYSAAKEAYDTKKHEEWLEMERVKKLQEEERERERIADLSEGQRWRLWKDELAKFSAEMPQFSSKRYSKMKAIALEKFSEIQLLKAEKISSN